MVKREMKILVRNIVEEGDGEGGKGVVIRGGIADQSQGREACKFV